MDAAKGSAPGTERNGWLVNAAVFVSLPFGLAMDVAHTSSWCDFLVERLNEARAKFGPGSDLKITWLETTLRRLVRVAFPCNHACGPPD